MNCRRAVGLISDYVSAEISARDAVAVEAHVAECNSCARLLHELRRTAALVAHAPRHATSDTFMAELESRLSKVTPHTPARAWLVGFPMVFRPRLLPLWSGALGAAALVAWLWSGTLSLTEHTRKPPSSAHAVVRVADGVRTQSIAVSATDPFQDLATANLALHSANMPISEGSGTD